jgi:glucosamine kinase
MFFLGIDGGGSTCRARLTDESGVVLAEAAGGPSNLTLGVEVAFAAVAETAEAVFRVAGLPADAMKRTTAGMGMAGANASRLGGPFQAMDWPFAGVVVASDAEIACLGAHGGGDGGILILGTGSQGVVIRDGVSRAVGGWGFMLSDGGSGAVLGHRAARRALAAHEAIAPASGFTRAVMARYEDSPEQMLAAALVARPRDWAALVPLVFASAGEGDPVALELVAEAAADVAALVRRLMAVGAGSVALMGGLAAPYRPYLAEDIRPHLVQPAGDALDGALALARGATGFLAPQGR